MSKRELYRIFLELIFVQFRAEAKNCVEFSTEILHHQEVLILMPYGILYLKASNKKTSIYMRSNIYNLIQKN